MNEMPAVPVILAAIAAALIVGLIWWKVTVALMREGVAAGIRESGLLAPRTPTTPDPPEASHD